MGEGEEREVEGEEEVYEIPKTPVPKEWVCLGSDLEILEAQVHTSRPLVSECGDSIRNVMRLRSVSHIHVASVHCVSEETAVQQTCLSV